MFDSIEIPKELLPSDGRFGSGPSLVDPSFIEKLNKIQLDYLGTSHRKAGVKDRVGNVFSLLRSYLKVPSDYQIAMGNGGASLVWDMMAFSLIEKKSVHFVSGEFSQKCFDAAKGAPFLEPELVLAENNRAPTFKEFPGVPLHCITWNETTTGAMYPHCPPCKDSLLAVDATSTAGALSWDFTNTDLFYFSPQKAFGADAGLWLGVFSPACIEQIEKIKKTNRHIPKMLDLSLALKNGSSNQTYNTPALCTIFLLEQQLEKLSSEGLEAVEKRQREKAKIMENWVSDREELSFHVENEEERSLTLSTINLIDKVPYQEISSALRRHGIKDVESYRKLGKNQLRISFFPNITKENLKKLTECINYLLDHRKK